MKANTCSGGHFSNNIAFVKLYFVVISLAYFVSMRKSRAVTTAWFIRCARVEFECTNCRHHQKITQVGVPCTAEMSMTKADNGFIIILVTGAVFIHIGVVFAIQLVTYSVRSGTQLHHTK